MPCFNETIAAMVIGRATVALRNSNKVQRDQWAREILQHTDAETICRKLSAIRGSIRRIDAMAKKGL